MSTRKITAAWLVFVLCGLMPGCSDGENKPPKMRRIEGIAKGIDLKTGVVSMLWKNDKGEEVMLEGAVKEDAEVWINGRAAHLADIRAGDKVVVIGYQEKKGGEKKLIATRVEANRPQETDWKPVAKTATSQPAAPKAPGKTAPPASR